MPLGTGWRNEQSCDALERITLAELVGEQRRNVEHPCCGGDILLRKGFSDLVVGIQDP